MKNIKIILIIVTLLSGIGMGAFELGFITDSKVKPIILTILIISIVGDAIFAITTLRKQNKLGIDQVSASEVLKKALDLACITMSSDGLHNFRANVFAKCNDDKNKICIKYHSSNMEETKDRKISFEKWQGCAGQSWGYSAPVVADLTLPDSDGGSRWGLTPKQLEMTSHLGAILAVPVRSPDNEEITIAILSFDTEEPIADLLVKDHHKSIALVIASQISLLLATFSQSDPLN